MGISEILTLLTSDWEQKNGNEIPKRYIPKMRPLMKFFSQQNENRKSDPHHEETILDLRHRLSISLEQSHELYQKEVQIFA